MENSDDDDAIVFKNENDYEDDGDAKRLKKEKTE